MSTMNIKYEVIQVDEDTQTITVRFFTDKLSADDTAQQKSHDGKVLRCRTDVAITLYEPTATAQEVHEHIMRHAPVVPMAMYERVKDPAIDTSLSHVRALMGKTFTVRPAAAERVGPGPTPVGKP